VLCTHVHRPLLDTVVDSCAIMYKKYTCIALILQFSLSNWCTRYVVITLKFSLSNWCTSVIFVLSVVLTTCSVLDLTSVCLHLSNVSMALLPLQISSSCGRICLTIIYHHSPIELGPLASLPASITSLASRSSLQVTW